MTESPDAAGAETPEAAKWITTGLIWIIIAGGAVLAWRNVRARRSDLRGAVRASLALLLLWAVGSVVMRDRIPGTPWADTADRPTDGLGITRTEIDDAVVFNLD